jgi:lysozyme family protein
MATLKKTGAGIAGIIGVIVLTVFSMEGGFVDNANDPGGATMYGITEKVARANGYSGPMKDLPKELASDIYSREYVYGPGYDKIIAEIPAVGHKLVDAGVNLGTKVETKNFQKALNSLNGGKTPNIIVDGQIGPTTINALKQLETRLGPEKTCVLLIRLLDGQQAVHYMELTNLKMFTVGWVDHRIGNVNCDTVY